MFLPSIPWLNSRKRTLIAYFLEVFSFIVIYLFIYKLRFSELPVYSIYQIFLLHFWILVSYVLGRYSGEIYIKKNFLIYLAKTLLVLILSISFFLTFIWAFGAQNVSFIFRSFLVPFLFTYSLISFFVQILISFLVKVQSKDRNKFLFLGCKRVWEQLKAEKNISKIDLDIIFIGSIEEILDFDLSFFSGLVIEDNNILKNNYFIFSKLQDNDFLILNIFEWCEIYLQRFPTNLITFSNLISNKFKAKKTSIYLRVKRVSDLFVSIFLILISAPIVFLSSVLIKAEDGGPILYKQIRNGYGERKFNIYKLRTMRENSEMSGPQWSQNNDKRITNIGRLMRVTRIDELPQLFSVLSGKMSLIGPRPERPEFDVTLEKKIHFYKKRYDFKPGLSGWAQVNYPYGASIEDSANKLSYDLFYVKNASIWLDLIIFFKTIKLIFNAKGSRPLQNID